LQIYLIAEIPNTNPSTRFYYQIKKSFTYCYEKI